MISKWLVVCQTHNRFRNNNDYENYFISIDQDYESEDVFFNGYIYEFNKTQLNVINKSRYGHGCDIKHQIIEYRGNNCFIPTMGYCFIKCINLLTVEDYKKQYLDFIRSEQRKSNIMTMARIQPCF